MDELPAIIGLTGGIATGKSTVSRMLTELGAWVIDADQVAREIVEPGQPALADVAATFGDGVLHQDGSLNREALGEIVFGDAEARRKLNQITHPRIGLRMMELASAAGQRGFGWVVYDAALIVENGLQEAFAGLIVVACSPETQRARLIARDGLDERQADDRIASQMPIAEKVAVADWVVDNNGDLAETRRRVERLFTKLCEMFGPVRGEG